RRLVLCTSTERGEFNDPPTLRWIVQEYIPARTFQFVRGYLNGDALSGAAALSDANAEGKRQRRRPGGWPRSGHPERRAGLFRGPVRPAATAKASRAVWLRPSGHRKATDGHGDNLAGSLRCAPAGSAPRPAHVSARRNAHLLPGGCSAERG